MASTPIPMARIDVYKRQLLDRTHAEHTGHIDDADAAQLDKMADVLRGRAHDLAVGDLAQLHRVVRHQTVAALDQLNGCLLYTSRCV